MDRWTELENQVDRQLNRKIQIDGYETGLKKGWG